MIVDTMASQTNSIHDYNQKKDKLHAYQCPNPDMVLRHPMSWYKHG